MQKHDVGDDVVVRIVVEVTDELEGLGAKQR